MKAVMLSIRPKWCGLIASGKKVVEIRKTRPKLKTPFKCYIYCTKDRKQQFWTGKRYSYVDDRSHNAFDKCGNGKVIGEFICGEVITYIADDFIGAIDYDGTTRMEPVDGEFAYWIPGQDKTCLNTCEINEYGNGKTLYGWHISELKIYEQPKAIEHFRRVCRYRNNDGSCQYEKAECGCIKLDFNPDGSINLAECLDYMSRPPQSWCYVGVQE